MTHHISSKLTYALFFGALLAALSLTTPVNAKACQENTGGACKGHWKCDDNDSSKTCEDVVKSSGMECQCIKKSKKTHGSGINLGIGLSIGGGGIGIDIGSGGYCDRWGCMDDYWDYPVFYGPVFYEGEWFDGPVYYRRHHGEYQYWIHGGWHYDEWEGERPDWARDSYYGEALGRDYYESDEFRHGDRWRGHRHGDHDGDEHGDHHWDHDGDHHDGDHGDHHDGDHGDHHDGDHGDHHSQNDDHDKSHDSHGDKDKDKDKDKQKDWPH